MSRVTTVGLLTLLCALPLSARPAVAQGTAPPVQGVTGTIATDGTIDAEHKAANKIAAGAAKILHVGGKDTNAKAFDAFSEGRTVVVEDLSSAPEDPKKTTEGVVVAVNKPRQQITVRFADKKTATLRPTTSHDKMDVVVSCTDDSGAKVVGDFKRVL